MKRLSALGLARSDASTGRAQIDPLVRSYLYAQGELEESLAVKPSKHRVSSSEDQKEGRNADVERAKSILRGESAALPEMQSLAERLKNSRYFGLARRVFARCRRHQEAIKGPESNRLKLAQRHALCTYRDPDLPADERFVDALQILEHADLNASVPSQETLGLAGAVHKYRWKLTGRRSDLERSYVYYARGEAQGVERDFGYAGINAAFVLNLLAVRETEDVPESARRHLAEAERIRAAIAAKLPALQREPPNAWLKNEWWFYATLAEAFFGLERYDEARFWLREGLVLDVPDWQIESTTRQLAALAHARDPKMLRDSEAWRTLRLLVGDAGPALQAIALGKVGLALSGGGFRASLFHIGVLARLAELDLLRHVEVLSCVSGGSILGAHYYLELRRLLKEKGDRAITRDDYLEIVRRLETDFVEAVQQNLRTRLFAGWWTNVRTLVAPAYTRTNHLGRLFERHIYARVADGERGVRWLNELRIHPQGAPDFNPKLDNWHRAAKGPILLLNATTLNTGHNWQFAVSWMGEPPLGASSMVDRNDVLRRMYYWEAPPRHRRISLGEAVAASACVPGLFDPIELSGLFPGHTVRLVDGGVHDNQGIGGLLEQECTVLIVSDASGQADTEARPSGEVSAAALRSNSILMARVREAEFRELESLRRAGALQGLLFLHLRKDLEVKHLDWIDCQDPYESSRDADSNLRLPLTSYGMQRGVQKALAGVRTDLDAFSDSEARALMLSGYRMADHEIGKRLPQWTMGTDAPTQWPFLSLEGAATKVDAPGDPHERLLRLLRVGGKRAFKLWHLAPTWFLLMVGLFLAAAVGVYWPWRGDLAFSSSGLLRNGLVTLGGVVLVLGSFFVIGSLVWLMHRLVRSRKSKTVIASGLIWATVGWVMWIYLIWFDPLFLLTGAYSIEVKRRLRRRWLIRTLALVAVSSGWCSSPARSRPYG